MILPNFPINKRFHNVSENQWTAWKAEAEMLNDLRNNKSGEYLIHAKAFLEYQQQIPLHQYGDTDYPEYYLYVALSKRSQQIADRLDVLENALRQNSYDPSYTGDDIPVTVTIDPLNIPANYLSLPSRATSQTVTPTQITQSMDQLWATANANTQAQQTALENQTLNPNKPVQTSGLSSVNKWVLIIGLVVLAYFAFKPKKQAKK
jgi:hypothetical protein